jgi:hypothetical protein
MSVWGKISGALGGWIKSATGISFLENVLKGGDVWLSFRDQTTETLFGVFELIDELYPSFETFYSTQTVAIGDDKISSTLATATFTSAYGNRDLSDTLYYSAVNGLVARTNSYARKSNKTPIFKDTLQGTVHIPNLTESASIELLEGIIKVPRFTEDVTLSNYFVYINSYFGEPTHIELASDYLVKHYAYDKESNTLTYNTVTYLLCSVARKDNNYLTITITPTKKPGGSYTPIFTTVDIPVKNFDCIYYIFNYYHVYSGIEDIKLEHTYIPIYGDDYCPEEILEKYNKGKGRTGYVKPIRLRTKGKAIRSTDAEYLADKKNFAIMGIDLEDIISSVNGDPSYLKNIKEKEQLEIDVDYMANLTMVDNSFLIFGLDISNDHIYSNEYFYKYFKWLYDQESKEEVLKYKEYSYKLTWDEISYSCEEGSLEEYPNKYGKFIKEVEVVKINCNNITTTKRKALIVYHRKNKHNVEILTITGLGSYNYNGGFRKTTLEDGMSNDPDDSKGNFYIPIHLDVIKKMGQFRGGDVVRVSMRVLYNSSTKVRKKWYATTWFKVIRIVVSIVIIIVFWGASTPYVIVANTALNIAINIAIQILITIAIKLAVKYLCRLFNVSEEYSKLISMAVSMVVSYMQARMFDVSFASLNTMTAASQLGASLALGERVTLDDVAAALAAQAAGAVASSVQGGNVQVNGYEQIKYGNVYSIAMDFSSQAKVFGATFLTNVGLGNGLYNALDSGSVSDVVKSIGFSAIESYGVVQQSRSSVLSELKGIYSKPSFDPYATSKSLLGNVYSIKQQAETRKEMDKLSYLIEGLKDKRKEILDNLASEKRRISPKVVSNMVNSCNNPDWINTFISSDIPLKTMLLYCDAGAYYYSVVTAHLPKNNSISLTPRIKSTYFS